MVSLFSYFSPFTVQLFFFFLTLWHLLCLTSAMFANQTFFSSKNPSPSSLNVFIEC